MARTTTTPACTSQIKPTNLVRFHRALAKWYKIHGRHDLPWRNTTDPYHIWLSEVMLQQTQVATVRDRFYGPFLKKFPTIEALAATPSEAVMKAWEGLGYYSRARNLHRAAKQLVIEGGLAPYAAHAADLRRKRLARSATRPTLDQLLQLPGIGRNTASAILAFAYHQPVAILEANVKRIVARVFGLAHPNDAELWTYAYVLLGEGHLSGPSARSRRAQGGRVAALHNRTEHAGDKQISQRNGLMNPFDYNQAMMDMGSMICTPKNPQCVACPASTICKGKSAPEKYPVPKAKKQTPTREVIIHVREDARGRLFLEKRDEKLLGGLYGFPQTALSASSSGSPQGPKGSQAKHDDCLGIVTHVYSHFKLVGHVVRDDLTSGPNSPDWYTRQKIVELPLSKLDHKVLALVENCHSAQKKCTKAKGPRRHH
jgi:A/G-specific adenine glycosylase